MNTCIITGAGGYLGSRVKAHFAKAGWNTIELSHSGRPGSIPFSLGDCPDSNLLKGADALVHCAYDFAPVRRKEIWEINVEGSRKLLKAASVAGIPKMVFISSISAFEGCKSLYGQAKLEIEKYAQASGALVLRPGLIYGDSSGGMFGKLVAQVQNSKLLPLIGNGSQIQYLVHEKDLCGMVFDFCNGSFSGSKQPITAAHPQGWTFRQILEALAQNRHPVFIPLPWRLMWLAFKTAELLRIPLGFRSDSILSLMNQNPNPVFEACLKFRPFNPKL